MPHDMHGRLIEKGDVVAAKCWPHASQMEAKKVLGVSPGSDTCNLTLADFESRLGPQTATAKETEILLKADGSKPEAPKA